VILQKWIRLRSYLGPADQHHLETPDFINLTRNFKGKYGLLQVLFRLSRGIKNGQMHDDVRTPFLPIWSYFAPNK